MKNIVILTGPSGSGISSARFVFEELAYYVVEGLPTDATEAVLNSFKVGHYETENFCLIVTVQNARKVLEIAKKDNDFNVSLILLTTDKSELLKRYALTRHAHPLGMLTKMSLEEAIDQDLNDAQELVPDADIAIDSSALTSKELRRELYKKLETDSEDVKHLTVTFMSFGLKNGIPMAIDTLFDVRAIPNPYWVESLKDLTGKDKAVIDYMMSFPQTQILLNQIVSYLDYHLKEVKNSERASYNIGIACSGGQHRSTFVSEYLAKYFRKKYHTIVVHRDTPSLNEK